MKRWLKRALVALCVTMFGITAAAFVGCSSCDNGENSSTTSVESSVSGGGSSTSSDGGVSGGNSSTSADNSTDNGGACAHAWVETVVEATCYADGSMTKECSKCGDVETSTLPQTVCSFERTTVEATCVEDGYDRFTCKWCNDTYKNVTSRATGHDTTGATWTAGEDVQVDGCTYRHVETAKCNTCQEEVVFYEEFVQHTFYVVSIEHATCAQVGTKTYACEECGKGYTEEIAIVANAHEWDDGETDGNVTTYTCAHSGAHTKSVYSAKQEVEATVPADVLANTGAVELMNAELKLDEAALASVAGQDVTLKAAPANKEAAMDGMSDADKEKLVDSEIFDFSMTDAAGEPIAFGGKITVTVPYNLPAGEDPDNIAIWYIDEKGKPEAIAATYSYSNGQGYATFETSHFSYYTVVRLSLAERCEMYGHKFTTKVVPATCGQQGYTVTQCERCHKYERSSFTPALVHTYDAAVTAPTCSEMGYTTYTCSICGDKYVSDFTAKLSHTYETKVVAPTCTAGGYTLHKCTLCGESYTDTPVSAKGHNYVDGSCDICGRQDPNATANFYFNLIESLATADTFYFEITDLKMSAEQSYNNGDTESIIYEMTIGRAQIGFDETGIVGKGEGTLIGSFKSTGSDNSTESYFVNAQFLFANGYIYVYVDGTGLTGEGSGRTQMIMSTPQSALTADMEDEMNMSIEMLVEMAETYGSGALDIVAGMANVNDNPLNSAIKAVVEYIYTKTETANGYSFELNEKRLKDMYDILMTKTVSEIFNLVFGATAYQDVQAWLVASVEKTIPQFEAEAKAELQTWGISLDQVYDYIDSIMFAGVEVPEGQKAPSVRDYIFAEELKEVTLLDIINMAMSEMGEEPLTADVVKDMINTYGEQLGAIKLSDVMGSMGGQMGGSGEDKPSVAPTGKEAVEEEEVPEIDVDAIIDGMVSFLEKIPVTFTTDKVGTLIDFSISMKDLDPKDLADLFGEDMDGEMVPVMSATMKFVLNGTYAGEYDHIVKEAEKLAGANNITENIETEDGKIYVEEEATYIWREWSRYREVERLGEETHNGVACTKVSLVLYGFGILDEDSNDMIMAMTDCHGWWDVAVPYHYVNTAFGYAWVNEQGEIIDVELDLENEKTYIESYTSNFSVYYNPTTGKYAGETQHNYKFVKTVEGVGCADSYDLYVCSVCGMEDKEMHDDTGHDWVYRYVLAEGSVTCEDGALEQRYCTKCNRIDREWETTKHEYSYEDKLVYTSPVCGPVYARVGVCPCGQQSYVSNRYEWKTDCQIDHVDTEWIETEGTKYTEHYIETYACAMTGCGFTYTRETTRWYEYDATAEKGQTCKYYDVYTYDFGNGVKLTNSNWSYSHRANSSSIGNSYGGYTETWTCTLCNQITSIDTRDQYDRIVRREYPIDGYGYYRVWTGCDYVEYNLEGDYQYESTEHYWIWQNDKTNCTQYAPDGEYCQVCHESKGGYQAPDHWWWDDHSYDYDWSLDTYVCYRCGTHNKTGADGWIVLEDMVEKGELKVGYFNKRDWKWNEFSYAFDKAYIEIIANYNPEDAENPGVVLEGDLFDREVTSPLGYREAGIITLNYEALFNAVHGSNLGISVETISVVFWVEMTSETTGESYVIGYGLTFTLGELGL